MFNMLRMDLRRLFKSRSFKIILLVTAALILMVSLLTAVVSDPETLDEMGASGAELDEIDRRMSEEIRNMTQLDLAYETLGGGFLLLIKIFVEAEAGGRLHQINLRQLAQNVQLAAAVVFQKLAEYDPAAAAGAANGQADCRRGFPFALAGVNMD